jgi:pyruvate dehydrogenase E2 component (dihydrolipoamide acetyltransferase)
MPISILMPALSPTMTEGTIAKWNKKEGDQVESGDVLVEIETDKATMEVEAIDEGTLGKILIGDGVTDVAVNTPIAFILEEGEDASALDAESAAPTPAQAAPAPLAAATPKPSPATAQPAASGNGARIISSPLARRMAEIEGLDLSRIQGSGPKGRIIKADVVKALSGGVSEAPSSAQVTTPTVASPALAAPKPAPAALTDGFKEVPNNNVRRVIAQRLLEAKTTIPHFYLTVDCELDKLLDLRKDLNGRSPEGEGAYKISVNDFVIRAVGLAMKKVPATNASWSEEAIRLFTDVDVSVAVATDDGLITPIIRKADTKGLSDISSEMKDLAGRAKGGKLAPNEFQGGGFTISNLGMFGVKEFAAIINPPQSAILAVGAGEQRPIVRDNALAIATVMSVTLSCDHRTVDGAVGALFLQAFKGFIEDPLTMML